MKRDPQPKAPQAGRDWCDFPAAVIERGFSRAVAFDLVSAGVLDTWTCGRKRFVYVDSLISLPERMGEYRQFVEQRKAAKRKQCGVGA